MTIAFKIDGVRENLRPKSGEGREFPNGDRVCAINQMPVRNGGMFADDELGLAIGLLREMTGRTERKSGNPVPISNRGMRLEVKQRDVFAECEMADARAFLHDQSLRKNPGQADPAGRMNSEAELFFEKASPHFPRKQQADEHEKCIHTRAPSSRYSSI